MPISAEVQFDAVPSSVVTTLQRFVQENESRLHSAIRRQMEAAAAFAHAGSDPDALLASLRVATADLKEKVDELLHSRRVLRAEVDARALAVSGQGRGWVLR